MRNGEGVGWNWGERRGSRWGTVQLVSIGALTTKDTEVRTCPPRFGIWPSKYPVGVGSG